MAPVREVYYYDVSKSKADKATPVAPVSSCLDSILYNICNVTNFIEILQDKNGKQVGISLQNGTVNIFKNKEISVRNDVLIFDGNNSEDYIMYSYVSETEDTFLKKNIVVRAKSTEVGGKYRGKDVKIIIKTDETTVRKVILEY